MTQSLTPNEPPLHDCEIEGPDTPMQMGVDMKTGKREYMCIWCAVAKRIRGEL